jgi:hypothetical protein
MMIYGRHRKVNCFTKQQKKLFALFWVEERVCRAAGQSGRKKVFAFVKQNPQQVSLPVLGL